MADKTAVTLNLSGPGFALFLVFLTLKLVGVITWSWLWVTAPLWLPIGFLLCVWAIGLVVLLLIAIVTPFTR